MLASDSSEAYTAYRDSMMHISAVPRNTVVLVTSDSVCQLAKAAYEALLTPYAPDTVRVYVYQIDNDWLVVDPNVPHGQWKVAILFDSSFVPKSTGNIGM